MKEQPELTDNQRARIEATLKRIRHGLRTIALTSTDEPAHIFSPEVHDAA